MVRRRVWLVACAALVLAACESTPATVDAAAPDAQSIDLGPVDAVIHDAAPADDAVADAVLDLLVSDAAELDQAMLDAALPDAAAPDAALPDAALPDAALPDAALPDIEPPDIESPDAGPPLRDLGLADASPPCVLFPCLCEPGVVEPCYTGPDGTEGVGICLGGTRTCAADGQGFGPCHAQQRPLGEDCRTPAVDEDCDGLTPPCSATWAKTVGDVGVQVVNSVAVSPTGQVIALVDFEGEVNLGFGPVRAPGVKSDLGLVVYDRDGNPEWSRVIGDADNDLAAQLAVGPDGSIAVLARMYGSVPLPEVLLDGRGFDDVLVMMLEPAGDLRWVRLFGGPGRDGAERVAIDPDGHVHVTGGFEGRARYGERWLETALPPEGAPPLSNTDVFAISLDGATGETRQVSHFSGAGADLGFGIDADAAGVVLAGRFEQGLALGAGFGDIPQLESAGARDGFLVALDHAGAVQWHQAFGGLGDDGVYDVAIDPRDDTIWLFGWFEQRLTLGPIELESAGGGDFFVARFDRQGAPLTAIALGDAADQPASPFPVSSRGALALDPAVGIWIGGHTQGAPFGPARAPEQGTDGFVAHLVPDEEQGLVVADGLVFGGLFTEMVLDLAVDPEGGHLIVGGRFYTLQLELGPSGLIAGAGGSDGFLARWAIPLDAP